MAFISFMLHFYFTFVSVSFCVIKQNLDTKLEGLRYSIKVLGQEIKIVELESTFGNHC